MEAVFIQERNWEMQLFLYLSIYRIKTASNGLNILSYNEDFLKYIFFHLIISKNTLLEGAEAMDFNKFLSSKTTRTVKIRTLV